MPLTPLNIVGPSYKDQNLALSAQECINYFVEVEEREGTRNVVALKGAPGLSLLATVGDGPCRGFNVMDEVLYVVSGIELYSVDENFTATLIGQIPGTDPVGMTNNGYQLIVVNGTNGYVYNNNTDTFGIISDTGYLAGASTVGYINGYAVQDTTEGRFFHNEIVSLVSDFTAYDATDVYTAESDPDGVLAVFVDHMEVWVFGMRTIEIWLNQPNDLGAFVRSSGTNIERGIGGKFTVAKLDNSLFWLGDNGIVYRANGYTPVRVSDSGIEQDIAGYDWSNARSFAYYDEGHSFYVLKFPDGKTWVYDVKTNMWHRRKSYQIEGWRAEGYAFAFGKNIVGDYENGNIYELRRDIYTENGEPLIAERVSAYLHANQQPVFVPFAEVVMDTGTAAVYEDEPKVEMRTSRDFGRTWSEWRLRSIGERGEYGKRIKWHGLGRFTNMLAHFRVSHNIKRDLIAANGQIEVGDTR